MQNLLLFNLKIYLLINILIISIECRRSLGDYIVIQNSSNRLVRNDYSIYDSYKNSLVSRLQSSNIGYNSLMNLFVYPSKQIIGSIKNIYSPFCKFSFN